MNTSSITQRPISRFQLLNRGSVSLVVAASIIVSFNLASMCAKGEAVTERENFVSFDFTVDMQKSDEMAPDQFFGIGSGARLVKSFQPPNNWLFKLYEGVGSRFAPVTPEESLFFFVNESDNAISCTLDIFEPSNAGFYPLAADGNLKPPAGGQGPPPERHWAAKIYQHIYVTLTADPRKIGAATDFSGIPAEYSHSEITMEIQAEPGYPVQPIDIVLEISRFEGSGNYVPADDGTLTRSQSDPSIWLYEAFKEDKADKHPEPVQVYVVPTFNAIEVGPEVEIEVRPVFSNITRIHFPGPGSSLKFPDAADKQTGVDFVVWKYGVGGGYSMEYSDDPAKTQGQVGYTWLYKLADNETFISDSAIANENRAASVIGHEAVHRDQGYYWALVHSEAAIEEPAYRWELDNAAETGIDEGDPTYLELTQQKHDEYEQQLQ